MVVLRAPQQTRNFQRNLMVRDDQETTTRVFRTGYRPRSHRRSVRLQEIKRDQEQSLTSHDVARAIPRRQPSLVQAKDLKRARAHDSGASIAEDLPPPSRKRFRSTVASSVIAETLCKETTSGITDDRAGAIIYWTKQGRWPPQDFEQDDQAREHFKKDFEKDRWCENRRGEEMSMNHLLAKKKSSTSLRGRQSDTSSVTPSSTTPSDEKPRVVRSSSYQDPRYKTKLATGRSFMRSSELGISATSKSCYKSMFETDQTIPLETLFRDDLFDMTCEKLQDRNEARVVQDITRLIVPSAETLATFGAKHLERLIESVNEGWNNSIPVTNARPQPDYSVGFRREAFTEVQLKRLGPFVGQPTDTSYFMATYYMYFPFLTCEVKCGAAALDVADRQNSHSMTLAVRGIVELFRLVKRVKELHREILAFSVSHDHRVVRIYGHYPIVNGEEITYYRHPIHEFSFTALDGREKWTTYKFIKNVYDIWMPSHFKRICSVVDELPEDINFEVSELLASETSGLSQVFEDQSLSQASNLDVASSLDDSITPNTSLSHGLEQDLSRKPRKRRAAA